MEIKKECESLNKTNSHTRSVEDKLIFVGEEVNLLKEQSLKHFYEKLITGVQGIESIELKLINSTNELVVIRRVKLEVADKLSQLS